MLISLDAVGGAINCSCTKVVPSNLGSENVEGTLALRGLIIASLKHHPDSSRLRAITCLLGFVQLTCLMLFCAARNEMRRASSYHQIFRGSVRSTETMLMPYCFYNTFRHRKHVHQTGLKLQQNSNRHSLSQVTKIYKQTESAFRSPTPTPRPRILLPFSTPPSQTDRHSSPAPETRPQRQSVTKALWSGTLEA